MLSCCMCVMTPSGYGVIFVSLPDGFDASGSFWRKPASGVADIGLVPREARRDFSFIDGSDPHVSAQSLARNAASSRDCRSAEARLHDCHRRPRARRAPGRRGRGRWLLRHASSPRSNASSPFPRASVPWNHENFGIERHLSLVSAKHPLYARGSSRSPRAKLLLLHLWRRSFRRR